MFQDIKNEIVRIKRYNNIDFHLFTVRLIGKDIIIDIGKRRLCITRNRLFCENTTFIYLFPMKTTFIVNFVLSQLHNWHVYPTGKHRS